MKPIIQVENISKHYELGSASGGTLREVLSSFSHSKREVFKALDDVSFEVNQGESVAIIGHNGAGKSTLLKVLSKITKPTSGRIEMDGRVTSLLEVGTGFHPELTGRENIYLNGSILGMNKAEIKSNFDEIVSFSGVEKFLDTPVKHYSSGMYVRLAFSVAAHLDSEILIVDEVLSVGDADFQKKCLGKMKESEKTGRTVIFVSHSFSAIRQLCEKGIWLDHGKKRFEGDINVCIDEYSKLFREEFIDGSQNNLGVTLGEMFTLNHQNIVRQSFNNAESIHLVLNILIELPKPPDTVQFKIIDENDQVLFVSNHSDQKKLTLHSGWNSLTMTIPPYIFNSGVYNVYVGVGHHNVQWLMREIKVHEFEVHFSPVNPFFSGNQKRAGVIAPMFDWTINSGKTIKSNFQH
jgi:lipopolysaccharide transport system ATP-binding protein